MCLSGAATGCKSRTHYRWSPAEVVDFLAQPYALQAVQLRRWDEPAKVPHLPTPPLESFWQLAITTMHPDPKPPIADPGCSLN